MGKRKFAMETEVKVQLTTDELNALRQEMELKRAPTIRQVTKFFQEAIDHEIERVCEEHPEEDPPDDD